MWSNSEPVEPVRRKRYSGKASQDQMDFDLNASASGEVTAPLLQAPDFAGTVSQADTAPVVAEDATPDHEDQLAQDERAKASPRQVRRKAPDRVEPVIAFGSVSEREQAEAEAVEPSPKESSLTAGNLRQTRRRTAAAELPRHERWKRRLHAAAW